VFEYKGFYSSVNRRGLGKYCGKVSGVNDTGRDIEAASICQLRQMFEAIVDEFLHRQACGYKDSTGRHKNEPPNLVN
jgi:hypothetical protein